jgi:hypothetical protein
MSKLVSPIIKVVDGSAPASAIANSTIDGCGLEGWRSAVCKGDEATGEAVAVQAQAEATVGLAGGDAEQPSVRLQRVEKGRNALEQRLVDGVARPHPLKGALVAVGQCDVQ